MVRADQVLPGVVKDIIRKAPLSAEKVSFAWRIAVGPAMARLTSVELTDEGVLRVTAGDQHWAREVHRASRVILARLVSMLGPDVVKNLSTIPPVKDWL